MVTRLVIALSGGSEIWRRRAIIDVNSIIVIGDEGMSRMTMATSLVMTRESGHTAARYARRRWSLVHCYYHVMAHMLSSRLRHRHAIITVYRHTTYVTTTLISYG